jgi:hypothetical protein
MSPSFDDPYLCGWNLLLGILYVWDDGKSNG